MEHKHSEFSLEYNVRILHEVGTMSGQTVTEKKM